MHRDGLPLLCETPRAWAELAAANLPRLLADHAVCEQQAALNALSLVAHYPDDEALVERMTSLAIEESPTCDASPGCYDTAACLPLAAARIRT